MSEKKQATPIRERQTIVLSEKRTKTGGVMQVT